MYSSLIDNVLAMKYLIPELTDTCIEYENFYIFINLRPYNFKDIVSLFTAKAQTLFYLKILNKVATF